MGALQPMQLSFFFAKAMMPPFTLLGTDTVIDRVWSPAQGNKQMQNKQQWIGIA